MRKLSAALVAAAAIFFGLWFAQPAHAVEGDAPATVTAVCPTWQMRSIVKVEGDGFVWIAPAEGSTSTGTSATLVKPAGNLAGTEFATADAGLDLAAPADITVQYELINGASNAAGAIRMFYYHATSADTFNDGPTAQAVAVDADGGVLTIKDVTGHVGTLGFTYDGSNPAAGKVRFTGLKVGDTPVHFKKGMCPTPTPTTTAPSPSTQSPTPGPVHSATTGPTQPGAPTSPAAALPVTGTDAAGIMTIGVGGIITGILLLVGVAIHTAVRRYRLSRDQ